MCQNFFENVVLEQDPSGGSEYQMILLPALARWNKDVWFATELVSYLEYPGSRRTAQKYVTALHDHRLFEQAAF